MDYRRLLFPQGQNQRGRQPWHCHVLLLILVLLFQSVIETSSMGVQTNFGDVTFASSMSWDEERQVVYVTGQVGANGCFVGVLKAQQQQQQQGASDGDNDGNMQWISKHVLPEPAVCQAITLTQQSNPDDGSSLSSTSPSGLHKNKAVLLATTEEGGLLTDTRKTGTEKASLYGLALNMDFDAVGKSTLETGLLLHDDPVQYPRSVVPDPVHSNYVYIAAMHSEDKGLNKQFESLAGTLNSPNLTPGGLLQYGSAYFMTVKRVRYDPVDKTLTSTWRKEYGLHATPATGSTRRPSAVVSNMIMTKTTDDPSASPSASSLLVVGYTRGSGEAFGEAHQPPQDDNEGSTAETPIEARIDGFITKLDAGTGNLKQPEGDGDDAATFQAVQRISIHDNADTYIESICHGDYENDNANANVVYVVGMSTARPTADSNGPAPSGPESVPFIAKVSLLDLQVQWIETFDATADAFALACVVSSSTAENGTGGGDTVYIAGIIQDGGTMGDKTVSYGGDDVFLLQLSTVDGSMNWARQIGTSGNDRLAHGGNGIILLRDGDDQDNGVLLMGDTSANLQATATQPHELFLVRVSADGIVPWTTQENEGQENRGGDVPITVPAWLSNDSTTDGDDTDSDVTEADVDPVQPPKVNSRHHGGSGHGYGTLFMILLLSIIFSIGYLVQSNRRSDAVTERALVFSYLQAFDVEEIDVRHSATGGWHGTYTGKLAQGKLNHNHHTSSSSNSNNGHFTITDDSPTTTTAGGSYSDKSGTSSSSSSNNNDTTKAKLSHSSIVKDMLFVDYDLTMPNPDELNQPDEYEAYKQIRLENEERQRKQQEQQRSSSTGTTTTSSTTRPKTGRVSATAVAILNDEDSSHNDDDGYDNLRGLSFTDRTSNLRRSSEEFDDLDENGDKIKHPWGQEII